MTRARASCARVEVAHLARGCSLARRDAPPLRRGWGWAAAEKAGFAVAFGLVPVVGFAFGFDVGERGGSAVGNWVDVVPVQPVSPVAALFGTGHAFEAGWCAEHERGLEGGGPVPAEVR